MLIKHLFIVLLKGQHFHDYLFIMLNGSLKKLVPTAKILPSRLVFWLSQYNVKEVRGDYLYVLEDRQKELQYMRQIETVNGRRGIVIKIEELSTTYVAMYDNIAKSEQSEFNLKQQNIPWQKSVQVVKEAILSNRGEGVFNANGRSISPFNVRASKGSAKFSRNLLSLTPLLDVCYDLQYGDMFNFNGCYGSRKTPTLSNILKQFNNREAHIGLYFNPTSLSETVKVVQETSSWGFSCGQVKKQQQTDVGVYILALKTIHLAKLLSKQGRNVLLGLDNFKNVLQAEWHMLQLLNNTKLRKSGEFISYNAPKIAPISLINEVYAACNDFQKNKGKKSAGSLTAVLVTESSGNSDDLVPQITPYTNNLKHLTSLSQKVDFPLTIRHNYKVNPFSIDPLQQQTLENYVKAIRKHINDYVRQKQENELRRKLYKSDMRDAPWDYYSLLDAEWWLQGLQSSKVSSEQEQTEYLRWIVINIEHELIPHWKIKCNQAYYLYSAFLQREKLVASGQSMQQFIGWAKLEGLFSAFKKDYLN